MVAGHVGKLIDFFLGHVNRLAPRTKLFTDLRRERRHVVKLYCLHRRSSLVVRSSELTLGSSRPWFHSATDADALQRCAFKKEHRFALREYPGQAPSILLHQLPLRMMEGDVV